MSEEKKSISGAKAIRRALIHGRPKIRRGRRGKARGKRAG